MAISMVELEMIIKNAHHTNIFHVLPVKLKQYLNTWQKIRFWPDSKWPFLGPIFLSGSVSNHFWPPYFLKVQVITQKPCLVFLLRYTTLWYNFKEIHSIIVKLLSKCNQNAHFYFWSIISKWYKSQSKKINANKPFVLWHLVV